MPDSVNKDTETRPFRPDPGWLDRPHWTTDEAAFFLGVDPNTLRVQRNKSRRAGARFGPPWVDLGTGARPLIRYPAEAVKAYAAARLVQIGAKKRGRPPKLATVAAGAR